MTTKSTTIYLRNKETGELQYFKSSERRLRRMRHRISSWAHVSQAFFNRDKNITVLITLTYREGIEWEPEHISGFIKEIRHQLKNYLIGYAWVAEVQRRGVVHYHILVVHKRGKTIDKPDKCGSWPHGMSNIQIARSPGYIIKYQQKQEEEGEKFPDGLRIFGVTISKNFAEKNLILLFRLSTVPMWLQEKVIETVYRIGEIPKRKKGKGWTIDDQLYRSPWEVMSVHYETAD
jgi:hypothetical protein